MAALVPFLLALVHRVPAARRRSRRSSSAALPRWLAVRVCYLVAIVAARSSPASFLVPLLAGADRAVRRGVPRLLRAGRPDRSTELTARYWNAAPEWVRDGACEPRGRRSRRSWATVAARRRDGRRQPRAARWSRSSSTACSRSFIAFYMLIDLPSIRREVVLLVGPRGAEDAEVILREVSTRRSAGACAGRSSIAVIVGVAAPRSALVILGVPYAGVIGVIAGVLIDHPVRRARRRAASSSCVDGALRQPGHGAARRSP